MVINMVDEKAKTRVLEYLETHDSPTEDDVAKDLNLHVVDVLDALHELEKEGQVKSQEA